MQAFPLTGLQLIVLGRCLEALQKANRVEVRPGNLGTFLAYHFCKLMSD
jgi:hypothetical protein